jgi:hypothetical protein
MSQRSTYLDQLQDELVAASRRLHRAHAAGGRSRRLRRMRALASRSPRAFAASAAAAAIGIAALTVLSSGSTPDRALAFPVLAKPVTDARPLRGALRLLVRHGADLGHAHAITTPYGTGYVATTPDAGQLCVAAPLQPPFARGRSTQYRQSCSQTSEAVQKGLTVTVYGRDTTEFVAVLPTHSSDPVIHHADGSTTTLTQQEGIATAIVRDSTATIVQNPTITFQIGDQAASIPVTPRP